MAAITFDPLLKVQVREQIRTGSNRFRSMLDAFVIVFPHQLRDFLSPLN